MIHESCILLHRKIDLMCHKHVACYDTFPQDQDRSGVRIGKFPSPDLHPVDGYRHELCEVLSDLRISEL